MVAEITGFAFLVACLIVVGSILYLIGVIVHAIHKFLNGEKED